MTLSCRVRTLAWGGFLALLAVSANAAEAPRVTAFVDVNVVPMDREIVLPHQTVVVRGDTIVALGSMGQVTVPADARRVEGQGKVWLMPGLADMHTHVEQSTDAALYLLNGVTTVLQMGGDRALPIEQIRAGVAAGTMLSPRIFFSQMVDGPEPLSGGIAIKTVDDAREAVRNAKARGDEFIKVYNGLSVEQFDAIVDEARLQGLAVIGHGVRAVGLPAGLFKGEVMVAHAEEFYYTAFANKTDASAIPGVVADVLRSGAYVTPNLSAFEAIAKQWGNPPQLQAYLKDPGATYMSLESRLIWLHKDYVTRRGDLQSVLDFLRQFTKALSDSGVPLLTGTDSPVIPGMVPGYSIHDDLRTLVEAGLSPYQALSAATRVPGEFITRYVKGSARSGVIAEGARADLLVVKNNPLQSLQVLRTPLGVMHAGYWESQAAMQKALADLRVENDRELESLGR